MTEKKSNNLRVVILTGSAKTIVTPLIKAGINVVGVSEVEDNYNQPSLRRWLEKGYWAFIKRTDPPYLSLYAKKNKIAYFEKTGSKSVEFINWLKDLNPDVLVLHQAPILPDDVIAIPHLGIINIHPSLLPRYRGSNPYFWLYYNQDFNAGVTLHFIDENVDTGPIIKQGSFKIDVGTHYSQVAYKLIHDFAIPMLIDTLKMLNKGDELSLTVQPKESPTPYAKRVSNKEYYELLDFENWDIEHLWHVLNANEQWRDIFLPTIKRSNWYAWSLKGFEKRSVTGPFGKVDKDAQGCFIKHKQGVIYLEQKINITKVLRNLF